MWSITQSRDYGGQVIRKFWLRSISHWTQWSMGHPVVIFPVPESIIGMDILRSWQNPHIVPLTCGMRPFMMAKTKQKPQELPLPRKTVNEKPYHIPGGLQRLVPPSKTWKMVVAGLVILANIPIQPVSLACAEDRWGSENDSRLL